MEGSGYGRSSMIGRQVWRLMEPWQRMKILMSSERTRLRRWIANQVDANKHFFTCTYKRVVCFWTIFLFKA